jgi:hypothetical protein
MDDIKFATFLKTNKIDARRLVSSSRQVERLRPEDRKIRLEKRRAKGSEASAAEGEAKKAPAKPRSGRTITLQLISEASTGRPVSGAAKTRLLRAVNRLLEQKKKKTVDLRTLF